MCESMNDMQIDHAGTELSFLLTVGNDGQSYKIEWPDGRENVKICIEGTSPIKYICPSVEGTVILCLMQNGTEQCRDTLTGEVLNMDDLKKRTVSFYSS